MKNFKRLLLVTSVALFLLSVMTICASAKLEAPVWNATKKGAVDFYREPGVYYRLDLYNDGEKDWATDTTFTPSKTDELFTDEFAAYHIEERGDGDYRCQLHIVDEKGEILESSPESEIITYKTPEIKIKSTDKVKLKNNKVYFFPSDEKGCNGYRLEFYYGFDKDDLWSFTTSYMLNKNVEKKPKDKDGYVEYDIKSIMTRFNKRVESMKEDEPEAADADVYFGVSISVLSDKPFEVASSDDYMTILSGAELEIFRNPFLEVDLSKYGKKLEDVIILGIDNSDASVFGSLETMDVAPVIVNNFTMLPIRFVAEALGAKVGWDDKTRSVIIEKGSTVIDIAVGEKIAIVNGKTVNLDALPFISNDRTYLPVRFVSENLGAKVEWDGTTRSVIIYQ